MGMPVRICWPHRFARCHVYALKAAAGTIGRFLRKVRRISLRVHTSTKMTNRLLKAQSSDKKVTTVTGSATRQWNGDNIMLRRVNALAKPLALAFQEEQAEDTRPTFDQIGEISDIQNNLVDYSDEEGDAQTLTARLYADKNATAAMDDDRDPAPTGVHPLPLREDDDANPELLAKAAPASFILDSSERTLGRFAEGMFAPITFVSTCVEGDKDGTHVVVDADLGYLMIYQLQQNLFASTIEVPLETNTSTVAGERFNGATHVIQEQWPDGIKKYRLDYVLQILKRWGNGTKLVPDDRALAQFAFNPLFFNVLKDLPFFDAELAQKAEDLLEKHFDEAADFLNEKANGADLASPVPQQARRRSSTLAPRPANPPAPVLGGLAGFCDGFGGDEALDGEAPERYNGQDSLRMWRETKAKGGFDAFVSRDAATGKVNGLDLFKFFEFGLNATLQPVAYLVFLRLKSTILTEAAVERLFSFAKGTLSDLRTSLSPELFEAMVFVGQNATELEFTWQEVFEEYQRIRVDEGTAAAEAA